VLCCAVLCCAVLCCAKKSIICASILSSFILKNIVFLIDFNKFLVFFGEENNICFEKDARKSL